MLSFICFILSHRLSFEHMYLENRVVISVTKSSQPFQLSHWGHVSFLNYISILYLQGLNAIEPHGQPLCVISIQNTKVNILIVSNQNYKISTSREKQLLLNTSKEKFYENNKKPPPSDPQKTLDLFHNLDGQSARIRVGYLKTSLP